MITNDWCIRAAAGDQTLAMMLYHVAIKASLYSKAIQEVKNLVLLQIYTFTMKEEIRRECQKRPKMDGAKRTELSNSKNRGWTPMIK